MNRAPSEAVFLKACRGEPTPVTPIWLLRQAGRYQKEYRELRSKVSLLELCRSPDLAAQVTVSAARKLGVDAAIIFADILLVLEPLGLEISFEEGEGPRILNPVRSAADLARLRTFDVGALAHVGEAVRKASAALAPLPVIGFAGAPFTLASYAIEGGSSKDHALTKALLHRDPGAFRELLAILARATGAYLSSQVEAGAEAVQLFDSWVGSLSPDAYREHVLPHSKTAISLVRPRVPVIHFGTGTAAFLEDFRDAGGDVVGLDFRVELDRAWDRLGPASRVMGNLDPAVLLAGRDAIRREAKKVLDRARGRAGHVFNLGHGIFHETPEDDARALVDIVHELSRR
ncbi:uroporphyrinogen decarboxylase [bacterium]|nr:uroporphyrinogen decarboxylase [bacterium]